MKKPQQKRSDHFYGLTTEDTIFHMGLEAILSMRVESMASQKKNSYKRPN